MVHSINMHKTIGIAVYLVNDLGTAGKQQKLFQLLL
jgi:hypothetical protein